MVFIKDKTSEPWKIVDADRNISVTREMSPEEAWLDLDLRGKNYRVVYKDRKIMGVKVDEYHWNIWRIERGGSLAPEERKEIVEILDEALGIYVQERFQGIKKHCVDFSKAFWG
jgi:hypothetical protein